MESGYIHPIPYALIDDRTSKEKFGGVCKKRKLRVNVCECKVMKCSIKTCKCDTNGYETKWRIFTGR